MAFYLPQNELWFTAEKGMMRIVLHHGVLIVMKRGTLQGIARSLSNLDVGTVERKYII